MPAGFKINGLIQRQGERLLPDAIETLVKDLYHMAGERDMSLLLNHGDDDFSFAVSGLCRFRVNALKQRGSLGLVIRVVSFTLPDRNALGIPDNVMAFAKCTRGMVLLTGPAGSGKTTTLACIVDEINSTRNSHIITIEDPIEYLHHHKMSVVTQRELSTDTVSYDTALRGIGQAVRLTGPEGLGGALGQIDRLSEPGALHAHGPGIEQQPHADRRAQGKEEHAEHQFQQKEIGTFGAGHAITSPTSSTPQRGMRLVE